MKKIVSFFFFTLVSLALWAQNIYPVQVQPTVISSSIFLQDYADQSNFRVKVSLTDLTKQNFQIRLKMTLTNTAKSIVIKSNQGITLTLDGGQVYFLSDQDLAALFSPTDLTGFTGNTLQEGAYLISFEATSIFDETVKVSNKAMDFAQTIILQNDPPLLNQPLNNAIVDNTQITNALYFTWMPRSFFTSPNRQVKYALRLVKINNVNDNPYQAITNDAYIIKSIDNVLSPTFILDPSDVRLEGGTLYAWQVQAYEDVFDATQNKFVPSGARFKNNGFSEVFTFTTKDDCPTITCLPVVNTTDKVTLAWDIDATTSLTIPNTYEIQYREQGSTLPWTIVQQSSPTLSLDKTQIQEGLTYEYKVAALCKTWQPAVYGGTFKLQKPACIAPDPIRIDNQASGIILTWDEPTGQTTTNYPATYTQQGGTENKTTLTTTTITLPKITSGGYNVKIDAQCDALLAEGKTQFIAYNDNGFVGPCPIPSPFKFIATRIPSTPNAKLAFTNSTLHKTYKLEYWSNATPTKIITLTSANNVAEFTADSILDNQLYSYRVTFICDGGKETTAPVGMFKISPATTADPGISPGTANCFPPAQKSAEARSKSSAKFDWSKVTDADEYLLLYRKKGSTGNFTTFATTASDARINRLDSTIYEYKIKCRCGTAYSIDSEIGEVDLSKPTNNSKCDTLAYVNVSKTTTSEVQLAWKYDTTRTGYTIFYKEKSQAWADQYTIDLQANSEIITKNLRNDTIRYSIINLKSGTDYQFKVQGVCGVDRAQTNDIDNAFTTIVKGDCESGKSCDRNLRTPITSLTKADTIQIADYKISIDSITAVAGTSPTLYKGFGLAEAPFVGYNEHIRINIKFDSLLVNTKGCVLDGDVDFISINTYILDEATRKKIEETMAKTKELVKKGTELYNTVSSISGQAANLANQANNYFQGGGDVGKVKTGDLAFDAEIDGVPTASNYPNRPALVKDKTTGTVYQIDQNGNVNTVGKYDSTYKDLQTQDIVAVNGNTLSFAKNPTAIYDYNAFDKNLYTKPIVQQHYLKLGNTYVDAKLTVPKVLDKVNFAFSGDKSKLKFVNRKGFVFNYDGTSTTLNLIGGPASDAQEIMAVYDDGTTKKVIGGLLLASYAPKQKKVILVRTNLNSSFTNTAPQIQTELNKIFGKIGVNYTVTIDESFKDNNTWRTYGPTEFKLGGNTALKNDYTDDAKSMQDKYLEHLGANIDTSAVYLFLVSNPTDEANSNETLDGKMNIGKPFGFLIINQGLTLDRFTKTLAHELCHGQYLMFHIFDNDYLGSSQLNSANLMAYGSGSELIKFQWDIIHDTGVNWGIAVSDKDQQFTWESSAKSWFLGFVGFVHEQNMKQSNKYNMIPNANVNWRGKVLYITDINLGGVFYPRIAVRVPQSNKSISTNVIDVPQSSSKLDGFNQVLKVGDFEIVCFNVLPSSCIFGEQTEFTEVGWNQFVSPSCVILNSNLQTSLKKFLTPSPSDNLLIFINGYRNNAQADLNLNEDYPSVSGVRSYDYYGDSKEYWEGISDKKLDQQFIERINTKNAVYIDGHASITTSNHANILILDSKTFLPTGNVRLTKNINEAKCNFALSALASLRCLENKDENAFDVITTIEKAIFMADEAGGCTWDDDNYEFNAEVVANKPWEYATEKNQEILNNCSFVNNVPNVAGFNFRYELGQKNGAILWKKIQDGSISVKKSGKKVIGKIDIVAHSMGYAHAQGVVDYLISQQPDIKFGIFYILAPENACSATTFPASKSHFEAVWQYGTKEDDDACWRSDGIAPQCAVPGLVFGVKASEKYGRIQFPTTGDYAKYRNFLYAHYGASYEWVLKTINSKSAGYVLPR